MTMAETPALPTAAGQGVDPITFEIVRHRLWTVTDEMALTLIKTAGNPSITEAHDFMVALFTANGEIALGGWGGNRHVSCTALACKGILARFPLAEIWNSKQSAKFFRANAGFTVTLTGRTRFWRSCGPWRVLVSRSAPCSTSSKVTRWRSIISTLSSS